MHSLIYAFLGCQLFVVIFIGLHDWVPLGRLSNLPAIRAADTRRRLVLVTLLSTLPFAIGFAASAYYAAGGFPIWLMYLLWINYVTLLYGILRAWWVPYLLFEDPVRAARYRERFANTLAFLPTRHGIRPDALHVLFHGVFLVAFILLGVLTFTTDAFRMAQVPPLHVSAVGAQRSFPDARRIMSCARAHDARRASLLSARLVRMIGTRAPSTIPATSASAR